MTRRLVWCRSTRKVGELIGDKLGCKVEVFVATSYNAEIEAMRNGKLEIGEFGPLGYVLAHQVAKAEAVAAFGTADGKPDTYWASIVTYPGSGIKTVAEIKGHSFAFSDPASTSDHLFPAFGLRNFLYYPARGVIGFARAVPDLVWALLFVTAVGLGPFPGALALSVHSIGMLGRLFAETIEHMDMAPIDALTLTGARRVQVFTHGIIPSILPSLLGIALYRLDENIRSSLVLGFVGAGGIGFELLSAMSLFQYQLVSLLLIVTFVIVIVAERLSALLRARLA